MKTFKNYRVETKAQYGSRPGYGWYAARTKAEAIKKARDWYNTHCKDRDDGRMTYTVVNVEELEEGA